MFVFRESDSIRKIKSIDGRDFYLRKSACGWSEQYIFYDEQGEEIESFRPSGEFDGYEFSIDGFYYYPDHVEFEGRFIVAEFSNEEFYEGWSE